MHAESDQSITQILTELSEGDGSAAERLLPQVYEELRALAAAFFQRQPRNHTLQPTALVHEAFVRLVGSDADWNSRKHFFDVAAMAMRQLLTDHARRRAADKRGGGKQRITLDQETPGDPANEFDLVALDEALTELKTLDPRQARIVDLRFLAGLTVRETAEVLDVSERTVKLDWQMARAWLRRRLTEL